MSLLNQSTMTIYSANAPEVFGQVWNNLPIFKSIHPNKINIEPKNHPMEKETHLPNLHVGIPCQFSGGVLSFELRSGRAVISPIKLLIISLITAVKIQQTLPE